MFISLNEAVRILNVSTRTIFRYCDEGIKARPMLTQRPLEELLAERESIYQELADIVLDTDDLSTHEVAQLLAAELSSRASSHNVSPSPLTSPLP